MHSETDEVHAALAHHHTAEAQHHEEKAQYHLTEAKENARKARLYAKSNPKLAWQYTVMSQNDWKRVGFNRRIAIGHTDVAQEHKEKAKYGTGSQEGSRSSSPEGVFAEPEELGEQDPDHCGHCAPGMGHNAPREEHSTHISEHHRQGGNLSRYSAGRVTHYQQVGEHYRTENPMLPISPDHHGGQHKIFATHFQSPHPVISVHPSLPQGQASEVEYSTHPSNSKQSKRQAKKQAKKQAKEQAKAGKH